MISDGRREKCFVNVYFTLDVRDFYLFSRWRTFLCVSWVWVIFLVEVNILYFVHFHVYRFVFGLSKPMRLSWRSSNAVNATVVCLIWRHYLISFPHLDVRSNIK